MTKSQQTRSSEPRPLRIAFSNVAHASRHVQFGTTIMRQTKHIFGRVLGLGEGGGGKAASLCAERITLAVKGFTYWLSPNAIDPRLYRFT